MCVCVCVVVYMHTSTSVLCYMHTYTLVCIWTLTRTHRQTVKCRHLTYNKRMRAFSREHTHMLTFACIYAHAHTHTQLKHAYRSQTTRA